MVIKTPLLALLITLSVPLQALALCEGTNTGSDYHCLTPTLSWQTVTTSAGIKGIETVSDPIAFHQIRAGQDHSCGEGTSVAEHAVRLAERRGEDPY